MTRRFDRRGNKKVHVQRLCGLMHLDFDPPYVHSYERYLRAVLDLRLAAPRLNRHGCAVPSTLRPSTATITPRTSAFTLDSCGTWDIAPAYDTCFRQSGGR